MNRAFVFGIAIFFAVVGVALLGAEKTAYAGHGCHGCDGCSCDGGGCDSSCSACDCSCSGRRARCCGRRHARRARRCHGCHGCSSCCAPADCCAPAPCSGCDCGGAVEEAAPAEEADTEAPAPMASAPTYERSQFGFRTVHFRR